MKPAVLAIACVSLVAGAPAVASETTRGAYYGAKQTEYPAWFRETFLDLREDVADAAKRGRRLVLLYTQDGCPYCNQLVERNFAQRDIETTLRTKFDVIALNIWGDREVTGLDGKSYTEKTFAAAERVQFTPTLVFFDERGKAILRLNGYVPPARFKAALDWVADKQETKVAFRDYVAKLEGAADKGGALTSAPFFTPLTDLRRTGKDARPLAVFFEQKDCPDCAVLHRQVLADPAVRRALAGFDNVQLDLWSRETIVTPQGRKLAVRDWARELDVKYAPHIVLFDRQGREVIRWESSFRVFHTAGMFEYVKTDAWRQEPNFQRFLSARAEAIREGGRDVDIWRNAGERPRP